MFIKNFATVISNRYKAWRFFFILTWGHFSPLLFRERGRERREKGRERKKCWCEREVLIICQLSVPRQGILYLHIGGCMCPCPGIKSATSPLQEMLQPTGPHQPRLESFYRWWNRDLEWWTANQGEARITGFSKSFL